MATKAELKKKVETLRKLARLFGKHDSFDAELIGIWMDGLEDIDSDSFAKAAKWLYKHNRFMPTIAEVYEAKKAMDEERKESSEYQDVVGRVVQWMEDNRQWDYTEDLIEQHEVDVALEAMGLPKGLVNASDI